MYGDTTEYTSDLVNSYAWDTAIIFIQTYGTGEDASGYASKNKGPTDGIKSTGLSNDKYCNIWDMSGNTDEWTTEYSTCSNYGYFYPCVFRGGFYNVGDGKASDYTSCRIGHIATNSYNSRSLRSLLYVK